MALCCIVCNSETSKYKCSTCYRPYCSLKCWTVHKEDSTCTKSEAVKSTTDEPSSIPERSYTTKDTIPVDKLLNLGSSKELKELLKNPFLQRILKSVDSSPDPSEAVRNAMLEPEFVQFVDHCLGMVEES